MAVAALVALRVVEEIFRNLAEHHGTRSLGRREELSFIDLRFTLAVSGYRLLEKGSDLFAVHAPGPVRVAGGSAGNLSLLPIQAFENLHLRRVLGKARQLSARKRSSYRMRDSSSRVR